MEVSKWNILREKNTYISLMIETPPDFGKLWYLFNFTPHHLLGDLRIQTCLMTRLNYKLLLPRSRKFASYFVNAFLDIEQKEE